MDNYVFCLGKKKSVNKLHKDMNDLVCISYYIINIFYNYYRHVLYVLYVNLNELQ